MARRRHALSLKGITLRNLIDPDEATSALDEPTEAVIADALRSLRMTRVIVAHRPATIRRADWILELGDAPAERLLA